MEEKNRKTKYITFSCGWDGCPISFHLSKSGEDSILAQVQDFSELKIEKEKEDPKDKEARLKQYSGMIKKYPARKVLDALKKVKNKDQYFLFFDQNNLFSLSEEMLKAGFTKGIFPTAEDYEMEKDRTKANDFVKTNYPLVKLIPFKEANTIAEAKQIINEAQTPLVIQSEGDLVGTFVPREDDLELAKQSELSQIDRNKDYSKGKIILKEKLIQPIEITPQIVFWNGEVVFTDLDIETKNMGDGENNGNQVGCGTNLIIKTKLEDKINDIAFPPAVYEMAKKRKGLFVWDISLYFTEKGIYFGEFCPNRFGYDAVMTEMCMAGGAKEYLEALQTGKNPLLRDFGVALRLFNLNRSAEQEIVFKEEIENYVWLYEAYKKGDKILSLGNAWDLGVLTQEGKTLNEAVEKLYNVKSKFSFKEVYSRTKDDFLAEYPTSIVSRFKATNGNLYSVANMVEKEDKDLDLRVMASQVEKLTNNIGNGFDTIFNKIETLRNSKKELQEVKDKMKEKLKKLLYVNN